MLNCIDINGQRIEFDTLEQLQESINISKSLQEQLYDVFGTFMIADISQLPNLFSSLKTMYSQPISVLRNIERFEGVNLNDLVFPKFDGVIIARHPKTGAKINIDLSSKPIIGATYQVFDKDGFPVDKIITKNSTIWDIFEYYGGAFTVDKNEIPNNDSHLLLHAFLNSEFNGKQVFKNKKVSRISFESTNKTGGSNLEPHYTSVAYNDQAKYSTFEMFLYGNQLYAGHHLKSEVTLTDPTQSRAASTFSGANRILVNQVQQATLDAVDLIIEESGLIATEINQIKLAVRDILKRSLESSDQTTVAEELLGVAPDLINWDNGLLLGKLSTQINSYLTNTAIRSKLSGGQYVLTVQNTQLFEIEVDGKKYVYPGIYAASRAWRSHPDFENIIKNGKHRLASGGGVLVETDTGTFNIKDSKIVERIFKAHQDNNEFERKRLVRELQARLRVLDQKNIWVDLLDGDIDAPQIITKQAIYQNWEIGIGAAVFEKVFNLPKGIQPADVTIEYYKSRLGNNLTEEEKVVLATIQFNEFQSFLDTVVTRTPGQGLQSIFPSKVTYFIWDSDNAIQTPTEMEAFQGADQDIDKGSVPLLSTEKVTIDFQSLADFVNPTFENVLISGVSLNTDPIQITNEKELIAAINLARYIDTSNLDTELINELIDKLKTAYTLNNGVLTPNLPNNVFLSKDAITESEQKQLDNYRSILSTIKPSKVILKEGDSIDIDTLVKHLVSLNMNSSQIISILENQSLTPTEIGNLLSKYC